MRFGISAVIRLAVLTACAAPILAAGGSARAEGASFKFNFSAAKADGYTNVSAEDRYSDKAGFGFDDNGGVYPKGVEQAGSDPLRAGYVTAEKPFYFSVKVPEGNYRVTVTLGDAKADSETTMKAELRRLMLENVKTKAGEFVTKTVAVNVKRPEISTGGAIKMNAREVGNEHWNWDDKLTLEFVGKKPAVCSVDIEKAEDMPTVYLCGDSTVCDQPVEPFTSWGQMITRWFKPDVTVQNDAISGETTAGFYGQKRMDKIMSLLKKGDYVFVQFGHNDMKPRAVPLDRYKELYTKFVTDARSKGATPVIMTPVSRESFGADGKIENSFNGYPDAVRAVAKEQNVTLIDLQNLSATFYESVGKDHLQVAFANAKEKTHHSDYGSYEIAKIVAQAIKESGLPLAGNLSEDFKGFDASKPDAFAGFEVPGDPVAAVVATPAGN